MTDYSFSFRYQNENNSASLADARSYFAPILSLQLLAEIDDADSYGFDFQYTIQKIQAKRYKFKLKYNNLNTEFNNEASFFMQYLSSIPEIDANYTFLHRYISEHQDISDYRFILNYSSSFGIEDTYRFTTKYHIDGFGTEEIFEFTLPYDNEQELANILFELSFINKQEEFDFVTNVAYDGLDNSITFTLNAGELYARGITEFDVVIDNGNRYIKYPAIIQSAPGILEVDWGLTDLTIKIPNVDIDSTMSMSILVNQEQVQEKIESFVVRKFINGDDLSVYRIVTLRGPVIKSLMGVGSECCFTAKIKIDPDSDPFESTLCKVQTVNDRIITKDILPPVIEV